MAEKNHIPTMPQASVSEHIPTMPQASVSEYIPTMPQAGVNGPVATMPQNANVNVAKQGERLLYSDIMFIDDKGESFTISGDEPISINTGEAQIYHCKKTDGNYEKLMDVAAGLSESDLQILMQMAERMKTG